MEDKEQAANASAGNIQLLHLLGRLLLLTVYHI
jgi:hypothetical protein